MHQKAESTQNSTAIELNPNYIQQRIKSESTTESRVKDNKREFDNSRGKQTN